MRKRILFILALFFAWLLVFAVQKPVFMAFHYSLAAGTDWNDWLLVVLNGLKLDATVSGYLTALPLLLTLISVWLPGRWLRKVLQVYYLIIAVLVSAIFCIDIGLYGFWGFRLDTTVFFYLQSSIKDSMASVPLGLFTLLFFVFLVYAIGIYWFFNRLILTHTPVSFARRRLGTSIIILFLGGMMFIAIRGGVTTSTANVGMVYFSKNQFLNHSAINPCFSLLTSISKQQDFASQFDFYPEKERKTLFEAITPSADSRSLPVEKILRTNRPNILLILLESFSANVIEAVGGEAGITPNIDRLSKEGIVFTNMYANSFRTDRGIVSVLNGYLAQPTTSIMKYPSKSQTLPSLAKSLGQEGYVSDMLYGGDINFTNMRSYFYSSGYSRITADKDFPLSTRLSKWGANDDVTFSWLYSDIAKRDTASLWMSTFLTLSSHEPFEVPFHHMDNPYLNSVAFTDSCLGSFIEKTKELPLWEDLLIILVSDHGYRYPAGMVESYPARYHIPMIWLGGAVKKSMQINTFSNQTDLAATLLNQLDIPHNDFIFSKDIMNKQQPHYAFYTFNNGFGFIDPTGISVYDNGGEQLLIAQPKESNEERLRKGKALLQTLYDDLGSR